MENSVCTCQGQGLLRSLCRVLKAACAPCLVSEKPHPSVWKDERPRPKGLVTGVGPHSRGLARGQDSVCCCHGAQGLSLAFLASQVRG